jgi:3-hydroxyisobutyrate dehydrogenase
MRNDRGATTDDPGAPAATVAFVGLGAMGYPMAGRTAARFPTSVWNRTAAVAAKHSAEFGTRTIALTELDSARVVITCLASTTAVAEVIERALPYLRAGTVWVDCTSGHPEVSRALAGTLAAAGVDYLDAPVSGMANGARAGTLTAIVGGGADVLERVRPVLESMCTRILHAGGVGAGHLVKAANNTLFAGGFWLAAEVLTRLCDAGIDPVRALECVNASSGQSFVSSRFLPDFVVPDRSDSSYRLGQSHRDIETFETASATAGAAGPARQGGLVSWLEQAYVELAARLGPDADAGAAFDGIGLR